MIEIDKFGFSSRCRRNICGHKEGFAFVIFLFSSVISDEGKTLLDQITSPFRELQVSPVVQLKISKTIGSGETFA